MSTFYAELRVDGHVFPLHTCEHSRSQATGDRGQPTSKVQHSLVEMTMDVVPRGVFLCAWTYDQTKRLATEIVYLDDAGQVLLTVGLAGAYCVEYQEHFYASPGEGGVGSYTCFVALADPDGFVLTPGTAGAYVAPQARDHGGPPVVAVGAAAAAPFVVGTDGVPRLPRITGDPPFTVKGPTKGKPGLDRTEYLRQLGGQQAGLNRLTVAEFLANRDAYKARGRVKVDGRDPKGNLAQQLARGEALQDKVLELRRQDRSLTQPQATAQASQWLATQTALHDPDQVAGGHGHLIAGMGDARVNFAIGGAWPKRITGIDRQIRAHAAAMTPQEQATTYLDIFLPVA